MRFFDAHCDTIGLIWENGADFAAESDGATPASAPRGATPTADPLVPHVTLPGLKIAGIGAQVFASWVWTGKYKGREFDAGMAKVEAVRKLCVDYPDDLALAATGADLAAPFAADPAAAVRIAVLPSLEGADALAGDVDNLFTFYDAGVRLVTLAWGDNPFCGSTYGDGAGLTKKGADLVAACEALGVVADASHLSDQAFKDLCEVAERPFVASHSNCRSLCPSGRNLTDEMIRALGERGGVMGVNFAPGFLSREYYQKEREIAGSPSFEAILVGKETYEDVQAREVAAMAGVPRPPLSLVVDHVRWAINTGGEDCVGLGADLDGVDYLPAGFDGVADYPRIEQLLRDGGLGPQQVEKVCYGNFLRVFRELLG